MYKTNEATKRLLREKFEEVVNGYLLELCNMWNIDARLGYWVSDKVGGTYIFGDEDPINLDEIIYAVTNDVKYETYSKWLDYVCFANEFSQSVPNFESWCKGCPRLDESQQQRLRDLKNDLETAIKDYKEKY